MTGTFFSLVPPIVAIALALITKEVYSSLFIGILIGGAFFAIDAGSGFTGFFTHVFSDGMIKQLSSSWNVGILVFLVVLGTMVALMNNAGGSAAFGEWAKKHIKSKLGALLVKGSLKDTLKQVDASNYGGAPFLGLKGLVVKTHGSAKAKEVYNSILQCITFKEQRINDRIADILITQEKEAD